ncbi:hypothetical protein MCOR03_002829 [Pyricularia oryzae]|uniref:Uncharacterized protein n=1 Tax=Pyricularia oryzae TaxID=318829 RepID=A0A4P7NHU1_PYROR|nr:hypothetical protein MCOR26_009305 [Pyricularia oryzae]KAI6311444.1 hypothetical protein MCOR30_010839 [Pyricularia oryzae]KAI6332092.1 hypothetical protein MCOR28_011071 [Pyricularia oryzae]KAI6358519.1 hypothetical protein MCOR32_009517 [Pyricularia oryzae]KAI6424118.1 hypothetical protein MCOR24_003482 [Pyricularia oryzae]
MAPSHHIRHTADLIREQVHTETDPFSLTLSTRQNDNSKDPDRSGRDRGSSRSGKGDDSKGARNDKDGSRGDRSNRSGGGRGSSGGRRSGDNDKNGDSSNNSRNRGGRRTDNDSASRNKAPAASSGAPAPATTMQSSLGTPRPLPAIASPLPKVEGVNPVNNAVPASGGQAGRAPPAAVNTPFIMMPNSNPSPVILLSTVIPDLAKTAPQTTSLPSAPALATGTPAMPDTTLSPELSNGINPVGGTKAGSSSSQNPATPYSDGAPAQQQQGSSQQEGGSMDAITERVLISIGSIVAFAILCFVGWMIWRNVKRSKQQDEQKPYSKSSRNGGPSEAPAFYHKIAAKIPFLKTRQQLPWQEVNEKDIRSAPLNRSVATSATPIPTSVTSATPVSTNMTYGNGKVNQPLPTLPRLQTRISFLPPPQLNMSPAMGISPAGLGMSPGASSQSSARPLMSTPQVSQLQYDLNGLKTKKTREWTVSLHQANNSFSSTNAAQFEGTFNSIGASAGTLRPPMASPRHNRDELPGETYDAYNQTRRQDNHASMLSSLSSGFGDADIIIDDQPQPQPSLPQGLTASQLSYMQTQALSTHQQQSLGNIPNGRASSRTSWMSRSNRDTVYTQASDDSPPRFRTISSWVHQQTSRVRRAEHRANDNGETPSLPTAPGWHDMPPEPQFNMMMHDGQAPRAPESVFDDQAPLNLFSEDGQAPLGPFSDDDQAPLNMSPSDD